MTICEINKMTEGIIINYKSYRETCQILCNYLMSKFTDWQVYLVEHDIDTFRLNFCSRVDRKYDTTFLITKSQLENLKCTLDEVILPTLIQIENSMNEGCSC